jgi:hypothetical protein
VFLAASEQEGLHLAHDLVNTAVLKALLSLFAPVGRSLALAIRDTVLKVFPDAIEAADGSDLGNGLDHAHTRVRSSRSASKNGIGRGGG